MDTTTGMSAPPMAMTMWTPKARAMTVIRAKGKMPTLISSTLMNHLPKTMAPTSSAKFNKCRAGSNTGLPLIFADNLPKAITEPEKVTAPIKMPT